MSNARRATAKSKFPFSLYKKFLLYAQKIFFPVGYPTSVSQDYAKFQIMNNLQHYSNSICFVIGTQALLSSVGLSSGVALGGSAAINWVLKDGLGAIGTVVLASQKTVSQNIDNNPKRSMLIGSLLFYIGSALEMVTPYFPSLFIVFASISNTFKSLGGLMLGSCKAIVNKNFANNQNLADITAKGQSQSVASHLAGVGTGILLSLLCQSYSVSVLVPYLFASSMYLVFSVVQVKQICFRYLNGNRSFLLLRNYFQYRKILTPVDLCKLEKFPYFMYSFKRPTFHLPATTHQQKWKSFPVRLNVPSSMIARYTQEDLLFVQKVFHGQRYFIVCKENEIWVSYYKDITHLDQFQAIFNALYIEHHIATLMENHSDPETFTIDDKYVNDLIENRYAEILHDYWAFLRDIQTMGWDMNEIDVSSLAESESRISFIVQNFDEPHPTH